MQTTAYFKELRTRPDRALIRDEWILRAIEALIRETVQTDGRTRSWCQVPEMDNRYCAITVEHASERADAPQFSFETVAA